MGTMNISIPDELRAEVEAQVGARGYGTSSEYVRDLIRRDLDRQRLRSLLIEGHESGQGSPVSEDVLEGLKARAGEAARKG